MSEAKGKLLSVNVGRARSFNQRAKAMESAIFKEPVPGRVAARGVNLEGDEQADRTVHGGPDKAIYAYAAEDYDFWSALIGRSLAPGTFGENLTVEGLDLTGAVVGERWRIGTVLLEVSQPRMPCAKLAARMEDPKFVKRFSDAGRPGAYLRIIEEGELGAGDEISVVERPDHGLTVGEIARIYTKDRASAGRLLDVPQVAEDWKEWARAQI